MYTKRGSAPGAASTISAAGRGTWRAFQVVFRLAQSVTLAAQWDGDYEREERTFARLLDDPELDARSRRASDGDVREVEQALALALASAYGGPENGLVPVPHAAHRFLQRVLYRINRLIA